VSEDVAMYTPNNGPAPLVSPDGSYRLSARRPGRELFPAGWLRCSARIVYESGDGSADLSGTLLEFCGVGLILQANGVKNLVSWDRLVLVELVDA